MLLKDKVAVVYGGSGDIGGAVARAFAREGARVFLAARNLAKLEAVARDISAAGGFAGTAVADALDEKSVEDHMAAIIRDAGRIDICFNAIDWGDAQGESYLTLSRERLLMPIVNAATTNFLTMRAAARRMAEQGSGVILTMTANASKGAYAGTGGFGPACAATEALARVLAAEVGPKGVRVVSIRSSGSPDTRGLQEVLKIAGKAAGKTPKQVEEEWSSGNLLRRMPLKAEVANAAVLAASDHASAITGTIFNVYAGAQVE